MKGKDSKYIVLGNVGMEKGRLAAALLGLRAGPG
jgi:hypothetical protein